MVDFVGETRRQVRSARDVADTADGLGLALFSGDPLAVQDALDDLLAAYDRYAGQAGSASSRLAFDELSMLPTPEERAEGITGALVSALTDLQVAVTLGQAGMAAETADPGAAAAVNEAASALTHTVAAVERTADLPGGRLGFDEGAAPGAAPPPSPSLDQARAAFRKEILALYDLLLSQTTSVLTEAFGGLATLEPNQMRSGLNAATGQLDGVAGNRVATRALGAIKRMVTTLIDSIGPEGQAFIMEQIEPKLEELRSGGDALQRFLKYSYGYTEGQAEIGEVLESSNLDPAGIDAAAQLVHGLNAKIATIFRVEQGIIVTVRDFSSPLIWVLNKVGGALPALPFELLRAGIYALVTDVAVLRGMDFADTTTVVKFAEGIKLTARKALAS